ncbi:MAG: DUF5667 domain-containing protein [Dehalococcoidales bacterium]|nr:DUF5667 domain-containing protein [Dehalococcoidales bacterium]
MSKKRDHLNDCLERLLRGEELESCLHDYPEEADELRLLLKTAGGIRRYVETAKLRPDFITRTQATLGIAYQHKFYSGKTRTAGILRPVRRLVMATALAITTLIVTFTGGFALSVKASENTMPGQTLYPVKLVTEQVRLTFAFSDDRKVNYLTRFAETRAEEIAYAAAKGDSDQVEAALGRLEGHLEKVGNIISPGQISGGITAPEYNPPGLQRIENIVQASSARARATLEIIREPAPEKKGGEPVSENKTGGLAPENKTGGLAPEKKAGEPASENTTGELAPEKKATEPSPEKPGTPASENTPVEPAPEKKTGEPASENTTGKPTPGKKAAEPSPEKPGTPASEKTPMQPAPEKQDKIMDRVDKAYSRAIEVIEAAKGDKGGKPDKAGK